MAGKEKGDSQAGMSIVCSTDIKGIEELWCKAFDHEELIERNDRLLAQGGISE